MTQCISLCIFNACSLYICKYIQEIDLRMYLRLYEARIGVYTAQSSTIHSTLMMIIDLHMYLRLYKARIGVHTAQSSTIHSTPDDDNRFAYVLTSV
jgi:hypothetical protein